MDPRRLIKIVLSLLLLSVFVDAGAQTIALHPAGKSASLRGLSVVDNHTAWVSGSNGWFARTTDGGVTWKWKQLEKYTKLDFRDIEAFSDKVAVMVNAGSPAVIVRTGDGGETWTEVYRNDAPGIFLDGIDFWDNKRGIIFGDPILGQMQLLKTVDGGKNWENITPNLKVLLVEGEASFAASGTTIRAMKGGHTWVATGGKRSRIFYSPDYGKNWQAFDCPVIQGPESAGPFSIAFLDKNIGIAAGGDYKRDTLRQDNLVLTRDGGKTWQKPASGPLGYRSAVEYLSKNVLVATGTSGTDISTDGGITWRNISKEAFNSARRAKKGTWVVLAGSRGKTATLKMD
ncbi:WD40/YVTN/BNR-like repeat-containing protein [Hufsiella ginkgonis]|uniref:Oxidoreductase n=1 Tax=Hufsiella ginkgonis TaxID=2695274 RepID=A0A7K1XZJ9_9SPHI|nr:YCF48-related protein [Hufsiella ginkgonis]MXV16237.1 oxidoreductase [Hufsiella ginkgonis]